MRYDPNDPALNDVMDDIAQKYGGYMGQMDDKTLQQEIEHTADLETKRQLRNKYGL